MFFSANLDVEPMGCTFFSANNGVKWFAPAGVDTRCMLFVANFDVEPIGCTFVRSWDEGDGKGLLVIDCILRGV